jgi:hypothetical protein
MANGSDERLMDVQRTADACAARVRPPASPGGLAACVAEWSALVDAVRALDAKYAFETDGREPAVAAVRHALPTMERDLFDAVVEDHACEVAALREAVNQLMMAVARGR